MKMGYRKGVTCGRCERSFTVDYGSKENMISMLNKEKRVVWIPVCPQCGMRMISMVVSSQQMDRERW